MHMIPIQKVLLPDPHVCDILDLYFRQSAECIFNEFDGCIIADKGGQISFDTYFNLFSIGKWKKYTNLSRFNLDLTIKGSFIVTIKTVQLINSSIYKKTILVKKVFSQEKEKFIIEIPDNLAESGLYYELKALEDDSIFYSGQYTIENQTYQLNSVKLGIAICTYKRESYIEKNIKILSQAILECESNFLQGHVDVFISDNGQTLDLDMFQSEHIHIFHNINAGGTSGFTRAILEMQNSECNITHILLMDDDITIDVESIQRTFMLLSLIKDEYMDAFIGGSMLRLDRQSELVETGAIWNQGSLESNKRGLNLVLLDHVLINNIEEYAEYNAWWYCCFPIEVTANDNLPLPFFIRGDDVEYGLRNINNLILMNGICVWHEPFENKYSSWVNYYVFRNQLIVNALHESPERLKAKKLTFSNAKPSKTRHFLSYLLRRLVREVFYFRYQDAHLIIQGVNDYLKGIDFLLDEDPVELHTSIMNSGIRLKQLKESDINYRLSKDYGNIEAKNEPPRKRIIRRLLLNGYLLPIGKNKIVTVQDINIRNFSYAKRVLFIDEATQVGVVLNRSCGKAAMVFLRYIGLSIKYLACNGKKQKEYRARLNEVTSPAFWNKMLKLNVQD